MDRRAFLAAGLCGAATVMSGTLWQGAFASPGSSGSGPYGALQPADQNGIQLPRGFSSRLVARSGATVPGTSFAWHDAPDGGSCFPTSDGGWIYVSNSEVRSRGGASALRFRSDASIHSAYSILSGTNRNCAGGATPWGTWLSCEEVDFGAVYETYPSGSRNGVRRPAMGLFKHEAAAADPQRKVIYLTEDEGKGCFYRFRPTAWGDLSRGDLEVLVGPKGTTGAVSWKPVPAPQSTTTPTRQQVAGVKRFNGGEGCYYSGGTCYFTTKGDNRVWAYDAVNQRLGLRYDAATANPAPLTGGDNITASTFGDLYVAEDGGNMEICIITQDGVVAPFLRILSQDSSEVTGPAFSPNGSRLYFSSQRGKTGTIRGGLSYEVAGPFRS